jgi:oligopeptide/dipeptide ABC transporter ATP-binding protein
MKNTSSELAARDPLLTASDVRVKFRVKSSIKALLDGDKDPFIEAVAGISLQIAPGETFAIVGESGSGKTTLARALSGLVSAQQGDIIYRDCSSQGAQSKGTQIRGASDRQLRPLRSEISMMFQDPIGSLSPRMTIKSLITEPFKIQGITNVDLDKEAKRLLEMVGLAPFFAERYPFQLSGGQARRVGVARALALSPKLIIADEPTAGLDVSVQGEILNLLGELQREHNISLIIITHNLQVVRHISDRMGIMYLGRFIEQGSSDAIFKHSRHPYTRALLSANHAPNPDAKQHRVELIGEVPSLMNRPSGCEFHTRCPYVQPQCKAQFPKEQHVNEQSESQDEHSYHCYYPLPELSD